jgi:cellobiose epimerase
METIWPLAGTEGYARVPQPWRAALADRFERILHRHVVDAWYPLTIDYKGGGFRTDFDRHWRPMGPDNRMLEYQARQTRSVARLGLAFPGEARWSDYARHGARYMAEVMHDAADGGWFWRVGNDGTPMAHGTKHAHSTAYVIGAMVEVYRLTGEETALDTAQGAFEWLDDALHDPGHGGYYGWSTRAGQPILDRSQVEGWPNFDDPLGHAIGLKDLNVHSDLCESFRLLYAERPSSRLLERASELYEIIDQRFTAPEGSMRYLLNADLSPAEAPECPGYAFQSAYRMPLLAGYIDRPEDVALERSRLRVDHAIAVGWASGGGVFDVLGGAPAGARTWWVQAEAMQSMILLEVNLAAGAFRPTIEKMMSFIETELLDERYRGWHNIPVSDWSLTDRLRVTSWPKAHDWKDPSHETDLCLSSIRMLRGMSAYSPLAAHLPADAANERPAR